MSDCFTSFNHNCFAVYPSSNLRHIKNTIFHGVFSLELLAGIGPATAALQVLNFTNIRLELKAQETPYISCVFSLFIVIFSKNSFNRTFGSFKNCCLQSFKSNLDTRSINLSICSVLKNSELISPSLLLTM